jgi:hypothetical protein
MPDKLRMVWDLAPTKYAAPHDFRNAQLIEFAKVVLLEFLLYVTDERFWTQRVGKRFLRGIARFFGNVRLRRG